ncbi:MAG TPA: DNA repair protein RadA [Chitinophagaceae bacterium]|nr:MAG: DNA repair protein RadA [Bacteroidetes bacterium OLB11]HMN31768.1 DNA repair protein RadA [Chitinophagaceae bacterium]
MSKQKTIYYCQECGAEYAKWQGKCTSCNQWNKIIEELVIKEKKKDTWENHTQNSQKTIKVSDVSFQDTPRIVTRDEELNRVLGGGIVSGSVVLVAGEPGIGKSTLFLQACLEMTDVKCMYISGEESLQQIKIRADRIGIQNENCYLLTSTDTQVIFNEIKKVNPEIIIIDSIQTLESPFIESTPGSVSQVRECAAEIIRFAKATHTPVFIIGHITKDGSIAGPKVLEHIVDTVLHFEGDRHYSYRILRTTKNRFGNSNELGIYEMNEKGLRKITNPSEILITQKEDDLSGIAIASTIEGARPLLIETQALVSQAVYGTPQRTVSGFDLRRLQLLLAVLEKRGGFHFGVKDVFINIAGGIRVEDPALDLAIIASLLSSYEDNPISQKYCFVGEVGLSGEIRAVNRLEQRILEADKLGFEKIFISKFNHKAIGLKANIEMISLSKIEELYQILF